MSGNRTRDWYRHDQYQTVAAQPLVVRNPQGPADSFDPSEPGVKKKSARAGPSLYGIGTARAILQAGEGKSLMDVSVGGHNRIRQKERVGEMKQSAQTAGIGPALRRGGRRRPIIHGDADEPTTFTMGSHSLMLGLSACTTFNVKTDDDPTADFTTFTTFTFVGLAESAKGGDPRSSLMHKRIESAVARELTGKGLRQALSASTIHRPPGLLSAQHEGEAANPEYRTAPPTPTGWRGGYGWRAGYGSTVTTYEYDGRKLDSWIWPDSTKKELIWRATIVGTLQDRPKDNIDLANKAIAEAFESYPSTRK